MHELIHLGGTSWTFWCFGVVRGFQFLEEGLARHSPIGCWDGLLGLPCQFPMRKWQARWPTNYFSRRPKVMSSPKTESCSYVCFPYIYVRLAELVGWIKSPIAIFGNRIESVHDPLAMSWWNPWRWRTNTFFALQILCDLRSVTKINTIRCKSTNLDVA